MSKEAKLQPVKQAKSEEFLSCIESIYNNLKNCNPDTNDFDEILKECSREIDYLADHLRLQRDETWVFAMLFNLSLDSSHLDLRSITQYLDCSNTFALRLLGVIKSLSKKRMVVLHSQSLLRRRRSIPTFLVPGQVITQIAEGLTPTSDLKCENFIQWLNDINGIAEAYQNNEMDDDSYNYTFKELLKENQHLERIAKLKALKLNFNDLKMFVVMLIASLEGDGDGSVKRFLDHVTQDFQYRSNTKTRILYEDHPLQKMGLIELAEYDFISGESIRITDKAREEYLDLPGRKRAKENYRLLQLIKWKDIREISLYFDSSFQSELQRIKESCSAEQFELLSTRLNREGFKPGLTILFHGAPGTGKTETCYQLAKSNQRDLMMVDMSAVKGKYIGESEKQVKAIFQEYEKACRVSGSTPILLLNESDALLSRRIDKNADHNHAVVEMYNTMQNILLQAMEDFEGILIATTNFAVNFDAAFERRFLFKLKFEAPNAQARKQIWKQHFTELSDHDIDRLVMDYNLTGAQIANIAKRAMLERIIENRPINLERIMALAEMELGLAVRDRRVVGFTCGMN